MRDTSLFNDPCSLVKRHELNVANWLLILFSKVILCYSNLLYG